ncbi:hypothetical protein [Pantoea dispersa]|uniref:Uncharacterized protein n=1 Tax=Pantoea dispersa TaxID=59814 RepID=A0ABY2ZZ80_9GAMM|nr:hypothetical protein [Pantoea dispersa]TQC75578.1 hypothetical protein FK492_06565 [Pantoea dispersa]
MGNDDNDRVELIANAILKAVLDLTDTGTDFTKEELLGRLEGYRLATNDEFMADLYSDAISVIKNGKV